MKYDDSKIKINELIKEGNKIAERIINELKQKDLHEWEGIMIWKTLVLQLSANLFWNLYAQAADNPEEIISEIKDEINNAIELAIQRGKFISRMQATSIPLQ